MNILIVTETYVPTVSGVANSTDSIARFLVSRGHTVTVIAPAPLTDVHLSEPDGLTVVTAPSIRDPVIAGKPMTLFPLGLSTIWQTVTRHSFDVMHIQEPGSLGITALIIAKIKHIPTVGAAHTMPEQMATFFGPFYRFGLRFAAFWTRAIYNHYDAIMTPTETMAGRLRKFGIHVPIRAVSNGINVALYTSGPTKPHTGLRFGYLGRIDKDKHLDIVIRAMTKTDPHIRLIIAGFGIALDELVVLARELHVSDKVTFIGKLNEPEIIALYRSLDCFVIPSPVESQSIVTLQAIACGLPVIAANAGALPELVHDGKNGYLVPPDDVTQFAQKMNLLADNTALRKKFGVESRMISLVHDKPKVLGKLEELYDTIHTRNEKEKRSQ
jgi:glycosyltransferase involved in cell wall biosynthesis